MSGKPPLTKLKDGQRFVPDKNEDHRERVGRVIIAWGKLEAGLEDLIWHFLDLSDDDGRVMTCRLDARPKVEMLRIFGERYLSKRRADLFGKLLTFISELQDGRNMMAHGLWGTLMPDNVPVVMSLRPKAPPGEIASEGFSIERMDAIHEGIHRSLKAVLNLRDELAALRPRQRKQLLP